MRHKPSKSTNYLTNKRVPYVVGISILLITAVDMPLIANSWLFRLCRTTISIRGLFHRTVGASTSSSAPATTAKRGRIVLVETFISPRYYHHQKPPNSANRRKTFAIDLFISLVSQQQIEPLNELVGERIAPNVPHLVVQDKQTKGSDIHEEPGLNCSCSDNISMTRVNCKVKKEIKRIIPHNGRRLGAKQKRNTVIAVRSEELHVGNVYMRSMFN